MSGYGIGGWGTMPWGSGSGGPSGFTVTPYPGTIMNDGGWEIIIVNDTSFPAVRYRVHLGPNGNATDPVCYPGVAGQGQIARVVDGRFISVYSPILPIGGPYRFFFESENLDGTGSAASAQNVTVVAHVFRSRIMTLRRLFPPNFKTEYREARRDTFPQV